MVRVTVLVALLTLLLPAIGTVSAEPRCFPEAAPVITACIDAPFRTFWEEQGGLPVFGYPLSEAFTQTTDQGPLTVQLFERAQLEWHPQNSPPYDIQLSHLGRMALGEQESPVTEQAQADCLFLPATSLNICPPLLAEWRSHGLDLGNDGISEAESLALTGLPLTPALPCTTWSLCGPDEPPYLVQWFERARLEDHGAQGILRGLLGREQAQQLMAADTAPVQAATPPPAPATTNNPPDQTQPGGFVQAVGAQLQRYGEPIMLIGGTYERADYSAEEMWRYWNGPEVLADLERIHAATGINTVRVRIPYSIKTITQTPEGAVEVSDKLITRMREMADIAARLDMRVIFTLFGGYSDFSIPGSKAEETELRYLERVIGNFVGDDRVLGWDIYHEPDRNWRWDNEEDLVLSWLVRMANAAQAFAPNQLVMVTMRDDEHFWHEDFDGLALIDQVDLVTLQADDVEELRARYDAIRSQTSKPVLVSEFNWASGPPCRRAKHSEAQQVIVYNDILQASDGLLVGLLTRVLQDEASGPYGGWDEQDNYHGLLRADGSAKPVAAVLQAASITPLPSTVRQNEPLAPGREKPDEEETDEPAVDPETGLTTDEPLETPNGQYVKGWFRRAWDRLGGQATFGLPLAEAYERPSDERVVQYFEGAVLEYHQKIEDEEAYAEMGEIEKIYTRIRPVALGSAYTEGREFPVATERPPGGRRFRETGYHISGPFREFYEQAHGEWRLGWPISEELQEEVQGTMMTVQYFQNGRLEWNEATQSVQVSQLGAWAWDIQCQYGQ
ncbi:MAG: cellulase family glycosylhydrolase [Chloroflexaceae bacterium]|nr:cellulase family glycosylhydrolase [Chloroflexaceae bacterium]